MYIDPYVVRNLTIEITFVGQFPQNGNFLTTLTKILTKRESPTGFSYMYKNLSTESSQ